MRGSILAGLAAAAAITASPGWAVACVPTGLNLDFGRYPIGASVQQARLPKRLFADCISNGESCGFLDQGISYGVEVYDDGMFIARKDLEGAALDDWGRRTFGWRRGDTVAQVQAKFRRATGKTLDGGQNNERVILLYDVCAAGPHGEYQFYANFGVDGRLKSLTVRIDSPYD